MTCHDLDTFRSVLDPELEPRSALFRAMTRHILDGLRQAGHVACDSDATRDALVAKAGIAAERTTRRAQRSASELHARRRTGGRHRRRPAARAARGDSSICCTSAARSRASASTCCCACSTRCASAHRQLRLVRVGGPFTAAQQALVRELGLGDAVVVLPALDRSTLAAVYRRSALLLMPSEREGFGLPVLEALACGTPVVASDIPALREVGGFAAVYCPLDDIGAWHSAVTRLLDERSQQPAQWTLRREAGIRRAAAFSWSRYASDVATIYARVAAVAAPPSA